MFADIEELIADAKILQNEISTEIKILTNLLNNKYCSIIMFNILESCIDALWQIFGTIGDFAKNYFDMKHSNIKTQDKYFHAKANC